MNQKLRIEKKDKGRAFGFTLTEILMVIVILGIMGAVAIPRLAPQKEKAYVSEAVAVLSALRQAEEAYKLEHGTYCATNNGSGMPGDRVNCLASLGLEDPNPGSKHWTFGSYVVAKGDYAQYGALRTATDIALTGGLNCGGSGACSLILDSKGVWIHRWDTHPNSPD